MASYPQRLMPTAIGRRAIEDHHVSLSRDVLIVIPHLRPSGIMACIRVAAASKVSRLDDRLKKSAEGPQFGSP
jgi:hypothetical protein